uniref:Uncharacterized protein n=1 Tax=Acrobeloides nanus TaxID=290746 RepID=A0A914ENR6_9BILA
MSAPKVPNSSEPIKPHPKMTVSNIRDEYATKSPNLTQKTVFRISTQNKLIGLNKLIIQRPSLNGKFYGSEARPKKVIVTQKLAEKLMNEGNK